LALTSKSKLIRMVAEKTGYTLGDCACFYDAFLESLEETLSVGKPVMLSGVVTFTIRQRKGHAIHSIKTDKMIKLQDYNVITCKISKKIKDKVRRLPLIKEQSSSEEEFGEE